MSKGIIYCCHCLSSGKKYIGQTRQKFERRINQHKFNSNKGKNKFYYSIRKYGWDNFVWGIIEECDFDLLNEREEYWIKKYNTYKFGYNSTTGGEGGIDLNKCKFFVLENPQGEIVNCFNISKFCRDNNLDYRSVHRLIKKETKSHKGWRLPKTEFCSESLVYKKFTIMSPTGELIEGKNVLEFCRQYNLKAHSIYSVLSKVQKFHKGWRLPETKFCGSAYRVEKQSKEYTLKSPSGEIFTGKNIAKFCRENNLQARNISRVLSGERKSHKGWTKG